MVKIVCKKMVVISLITSIFLLTSVSAEEADSVPEIEMVDPWPSDLGDGDHLYTDAGIKGEVADSWFEVHDDEGELQGRGTLKDTVGDGYFVSPTAVKVEGGEEYTLEVNACDAGDNCVSKEKTITTSCKIDLFGKCWY